MPTTLLLLRERIAQPYKDSYQVIGVILLVGLEALSGTRSRKWMHQLNCIRVMTNTLRNGEKPARLSWELKYLDGIADS